MKIFGIILFLILFLICAFLMRKGILKKYDDKVYNKIAFSDYKTLFYKYFTNLACTPYFIIVCVLMVLFLENKKLAIIISIIMIIDALVVFVVKHIFKRERPNKKRLVKEKGYSFPSGHTFSATSFYGFLLFVLASGSSIYMQIILLGLYILLVVLIARSRIYLGVHYFSDVVAGFLLSICYLLLCVYLVYDFLNLL